MQNGNKQQPKPVFVITEDHVQEEASTRIGRRLDEDEMHCVKKGIESGLSFDLDTVLETAIADAVELRKNGNA